MTLMSMYTPYNLFNNASPTVGDSLPVAVPARCTLLDCRSSFGTNPGSIEIQLLGSLNGIDFVEVGKSIASNGETFTIEANLSHVKSRINSVSGGAGVSLVVTCKNWDDLD